VYPFIDIGDAMDHLNIFHPYKDLAPHHENSLTRAFLIVLRSVPSAHAAWLDLVDRGHRKSNGSGVPSLHELSQAQVATQVGALPERVSRIISVLQTDEHYFAKSDVGSSDRTQVLDGVVNLGAKVRSLAYLAHSVFDGPIRKPLERLLALRPRYGNSRLGRLAHLPLGQLRFVQNANDRGDRGQKV
jgi:hypothetical protein